MRWDAILVALAAQFLFNPASPVRFTAGQEVAELGISACGLFGVESPTNHAHLLAAAYRARAATSDISPAAMACSFRHYSLSRTPWQLAGCNINCFHQRQNLKKPAGGNDQRLCRYHMKFLVAAACDAIFVSCYISPAGVISDLETAAILLFGKEGQLWRENGLSRLLRTAFLLRLDMICSRHSARLW